MRKSLMFVMLGIISFLGINSVSADTFTNNNYYKYYDEMIDYYNNNQNVINELLNIWKTNYSEAYPYYLITYNKYSIHLYTLKENSYDIYPVHSLQSVKMDIDYYDILYKIDEQTYSTTYMDSYVFTLTSIDVFTYLTSNIDFIYTPYEDITSYLIPSYTSEKHNIIIPEIKYSTGDIIHSALQLYNGDYSENLKSYTEINLNNYSSVILTLKDYTPRDTFTSTLYVKGQLCPTTVYNYGMEEKKDYISGYQNQPCSYYFNDFTPFVSYIKSEDIKNHAVYYLTTNDKSKPNLIKIDNSIYNITYITEENKNNPYVSIGGKNYPVLPYDSLTDSATLTEKNGISNEWTCAKYDTDCLENSSGMNINDLFDKPLEFLKGLWSSITSIFEVITEFLSLLPETMQSFLYLSFMVAIVLGLLKLIL